ncbi:hypothetical protein DUNSADRAFT_6471 [Dunaliella salina]|uniref:Reticulon-like protein n=1 Tax=Dunaliella salina TaxID=3046 RepID=A0ABQ7GNB7_DUNSA|nr:hypothetical protein DUNSADRAFT_6471 [Dunaliella salina]|eukprot:KAF5836100.1 hypothetical protein DUNSADRAFT_6471 [Dunaliella salina]
MSSDAKLAAEARRAKILARSKARINSVGGGLADEEPPQQPAASSQDPAAYQEPSPLPVSAQQLPAQLQSPQADNTSSAETPAAAPPIQEYAMPTQPAIASSNQTAADNPAQQGQHDHLCPARPNSPTSQQHHLFQPLPCASPDSHSPATKLRHRNIAQKIELPEASGRASTTQQQSEPAESDIDTPRQGSTVPGAAAATTSSAPPTSLLNTSVRASRLIRYVAALMYARALVYASGPPLFPPMLVLMVTQLAIILGTRLILGSPMLHQKLDFFTTAAEVEIPARLRSFDTWGFLLRLSPELRAVFESLASILACVKGLTDGIAVFLVAYVLMQQTHDGTV